MILPTYVVGNEVSVWGRGTDGKSKVRVSVCVCMCHLIENTIPTNGFQVPATVNHFSKNLLCAYACASKLQAFG